MNNLREKTVDEVLRDIERMDGYEKVKEMPSIGMLWGELSQIEFTDTDKIIFGLGRGQVGMMVASTDVGKTTFTLNLILTLAAGGIFPPFIEKRKMHRIMFIDGENTQAELQTDLIRMMRDWSEAERDQVKDNLLILCDEEVDNEPITINNPNHMAAIMQKAKSFKPDLIIVDTVAALFNLYNENDNAEVKRAVIQPLKMLGKAANAAVMMNHHSGKFSEESQSSVRAYRGRGASNFGGLARSVITLTPDKSDRFNVIFSVPKAKGYRIDDMLMRLERGHPESDSRWFTVLDRKPIDVKTSYEETLALVNQPMATADIVKAFEGKYSTRMIEENLKQAVKRSDLNRLKRGLYAPQIAAYPAPSYSEGGNYGNDESDDVLDLENDSVN